MTIKTKYLKKIKPLGYSIALLTCVSLVYIVANHYSFIAALSPKKAQLSPTSLSLIENFQDKVQFTLYSRDHDKHREAALLIEQYQQKNPNIGFEWKQEDYPFSEKHIGEALLAHYQQQQYFIDLTKSSISEGSVSQLLFKFKRHANAWIVFLEGHGEPTLFGKENRDFNLWRKALENQGLKVQPLTLSNTNLIADNTQLVVIASMQSELLPLEERLLLNYLDNGGHLLWLMDPSAKRQPFLEHYFGVIPMNGTIVDLHGQKLGTPHPAITLIEDYPALPFSAPNLLSVYPWSNALKIENSSWKDQPLLVTHEATWTEFSALTGEIRFDPERGEIAGPLLLGVTLTRAHPLQPLQQQRVAIIGNSRFISNGVIENYGNLAFGQNLISWLNQDDQLITLEQPVSSDSFAHIHSMTAYLIQFGFPGLGLTILLGTALYAYRRIHNSRKYSAMLSRE